jgi:hypothetical protein
MEKDNSFLWKIVRPNLNDYPFGLEAERLKRGLRARFLRLCLDSVALTPLGRRSLLFRKLLDLYSRSIEPFQKQVDKKFQPIVRSEKEEVLSERESCENRYYNVL